MPAVMTIEQPGLFFGIDVAVSEIKLPVKPKAKRALKPRRLVGSILHLGAGRQSSAIAEMMVEGDLLPADVAIFSDTGNEPRHVYEQVEYLRGRLESAGISLVVVKHPGLGLVEQIMQGQGRFATMPCYTLNIKTGKVSILRRQCTNDYKITPSDNYLRDWLAERGHITLNKAGQRRVNTDIYVENIYGISADEQYRAGKRGPGWQQASYPLIVRNWGVSDCIDYLQARGLRIPRKSSCKVCPYHEDEYWLTMQTETPDEFEETCQFDDFIRTPNATYAQGSNRGKINDLLFLHRSCQPLREIDFAALVAKKRMQRSMFSVELITGKTCATDGGFSCMS